MISSGRKTTPIQHNGRAPENSSSCGRIILRQATIAAGTTTRDASKEIGNAGRHYRFPEHWKRNASDPTIRLARVPGGIRENVIRSRRTKGQTAPQRSTCSSSGKVCGSAAALLDRKQPAKPKSPVGR